MAAELTLSKKGFWLLAMVSAVLAILIFIAGCLIGAMVSLQPTKPSVVEPATKGNIVRQKIPVQEPAIKGKEIVKLPVAVAPPKVQPPTIEVPELVLPKPGTLKKAIIAPPKPPPEPKSEQPRPVIQSGSGAEASKTESVSDSPNQPEDTEKKVGDTGAEPPPGTGEKPEKSAKKTDDAAEKPAKDSRAESGDAAVSAEKKDAAPKPKPDDPSRKTAARADTFEPEYPFSLRLGSYRKLKTALEAVRSFRANGVSAYPVKVYLGKKGTWWRIYTGYYRNREEAMATRDYYGLENAEIVRTRWAVLVGIFDDEAGMAGTSDRLKASGYYPYAIKTDAGGFGLFSGAFITRIGAESHRRELKDSGIESRPVQR